MTGQAGQPTWASRAVVALAGLLAVVLLTAVGVATLRDSSVADADTVLEEGVGVRLELPDGRSREAVVGERVPQGATVRAGTAGAVLQTRERRVFLGQATSLTVLDGARQSLDAGYVMVEASDGPGLELTTAAAVVSAADGSLVRVVAGPLVRVGVLRGDAARVRAAGRQATTEVPRYYQAQVAVGGLPTEATPLLLTGDAFEMRLARELYDADRDLNALARRLDTAGEAGPAVLAVLSSVVPAAAPVPGAPESERALGYLLAAASDPDQAGEAYTEVRGLRTAGGSWGVVAALVETTPNEVSAVLGALLDSGDVPVLASGPVGPGTSSPADLLPLLLDPTVPGSPTGAPAAPGPAPSAPGAPQPSPVPTPGTPVPTPVPSPPATGVPLVDDLVDTVLDLLDPSPAPVLPPPTGTAPAPSPEPVPLLEIELPLLPLLR